MHNYGVMNNCGFECLTIHIGRKIYVLSIDQLDCKRDFRSGHEAIYLILVMNFIAEG